MSNKKHTPQDNTKSYNNDNYNLDKELLNLLSDYILLVNNKGDILWSNDLINNATKNIKSIHFGDIAISHNPHDFYNFLSQSNNYLNRIDKNGKPQWIHWSKKEIIYNNNTCFLLIGKEDTLLTEDADYFNELAKEAQFGYYEYSLEDRIIHLNPAVCKILGIDSSIKKIHMEDYIKMIHPNDNAGYISWLNFSMQTDEFHNFEYRIIDHDNQVKYLKTHVKNIYNQGDILLRRTVFIHNISTLKDTINNLTFSELKFRSIFNEAPIGIMYVANSGIILDVNEPGLKILGSPSKEETLKINILQLESAQEFGISEKVKICIDTAKNQHFTTKYLSKWNKESLLKFNIAALKDSNNIVSGVVILAEDITLQIHTEEKLSESENRYLKILDLNPDTIIIFDDNFKIIDFHKPIDNSCILFNEIALGDNLENQLPNDVFKALRTHTNKTLEDKQFIEFKIKVTINKVQLSLEARVAQFDQISTMVIFKEVTEDVLREKQLADQKLQLKEASNIAKIGWYEVIGSEGYYYGSWQTHNIFFDEQLGNPIEKEHLISAIHPDDAQRFFETVQENIKNKSQYFTWEYRVITHKKNLKYIWTKTYLNFDEEGNLTGRFGVVQDITDIRNTQNALEESQQRLIQAQKQAKLGWYEYNIQTKKYIGSPEAFQLYFDDPTIFECPIERVLEVMHPDDRDSFIEKQLEYLDSIQEGFTHTHRIISPKNKIKHVLVKVHSEYNEHGEVVKRDGIAQDITDQVIAQNALRESESRFKGIFMHSPIGIIIFNHKGSYIASNNVVHRNFKTTSHNRLENINLLESQTIPNELLIKLKNGELISFEGQLANDFLSELNPFDKKYIQKKYFEFQMTLLDKDETSSGYIALITDISDRKKMELEIIDAKNKAEDADELKSAFLANMSHEIRTPLNAILGFSSLLEFEDYSREEYREFVSTINTNGQYLLNIINDIIDFSKIEANQLSLHFDTVDINTLLQEIHSLMFNLAPTEVDFKYHCSLSQKDATIYSDQQRIHQVFINLINNAFKFTDKGSVQFGYNLSLNKKNIEFYVKDTGCGIEDEKSPEVFNRFHQLNHIKHGAGLGLSISQGIVNLLDGKIWLDSKINEGSTFYFSLPINKKGS